MGDELEAPRRRALETALLLREEAGTPVDFRTLAVAVRSALHLLAERRPILLAVDDVQWLDGPSRTALEFALRRLQGENIRLLLARRPGGGAEGSELELALDSELIERRHVGPAQSGRAARDPAAEARPGIRAADAAAHPRSGGRQPLLCLELARALGDNVDPTQPLPVPATLEALVRARLDGLPDETRRALLLACTHGRLTPAQLDADALEPAFADNVIELDDG